MGIKVLKCCYFMAMNLWSHKVGRESQLPSTKTFRGFKASLIDNPDNFSFSEIIAIIKPFQ